MLALSPRSMHKTLSHASQTPLTQKALCVRGVWLTRLRNTELEMGRVAPGMNLGK